MSALLQTAFSGYNLGYMKTFGERFKKMREEKGFTANSLAIAAGLLPVSIYEIEKNKRPASDSVLEKIAAVKELDVTFDQLKGLQIIYKATPAQLMEIKRELEAIGEVDAPQ